MKHYTITKYNSLVRIVALPLSEYEIGLEIADGTRKSLKEFGQGAVAKLNGTTFETVNLKSIHYGWFKNSDVEINKPDATNKMTDCYFLSNGKFVIDSNPPADVELGISLLFGLVKNGKINTVNMNQYAHHTTKTVGTGIGQKRNTVYFIRANSMTGDEFAKTGQELGLDNFCNCDGGGSGQIEVNGTHYGDSRQLGTVFVARPLPKITVKTKVMYGNKEVPAFITNQGRTYVEARTMSELIGKQISYDSKTKRVTIY